MTRVCGRGTKFVIRVAARVPVSCVYTAHLPRIGCRLVHSDSLCPPVLPSLPVVAEAWLPTPPSERALLVQARRPLYDSPSARDAGSRDHCIGDRLWPTVVSKLRRLVTAPYPPPALFPSQSAWARFVAAAAASVGGGAAGSTTATTTATATADFLHTHCLPLVGAVGLAHFGPALAAARAVRGACDLRSPHARYPAARAMKRRIIFHAGPTNSGKTYRALAALRAAHSGLYAGPLRLLALEVYESLNTDGVPCSLLTGQERRILPFARHTSATVEMVGLEGEEGGRGGRPPAYDVAVIDEIQMIGDEARGSAWTRALLGLAVPEIHVCGDPAAEPVLRALLADCGDDLEVRTYTRLSTMTPLTTSLGDDYSGVEAGDCIIAFSRRDIYAIRKTIERKTAHKVCVVYGQLPPETRSAQARLFNDPSSEYRVLVASDAVGMGLNLNIRRVVFHTMDKFNGDGVGPVPPPLVKQIAGRAGRASSLHPDGFSTTLAPGDLPYLHACLGAPSPPITRAGLFPDADQLVSFASHMPPDTPLAGLIQAFLDSSTLDGPFFMCRGKDMTAAAELIQGFPLTLRQRCALTLVPANLKHPEVRAYFLKYLDAYCSGGRVPLALQLPLADPGYLTRHLDEVEVKHAALNVYLWLGHRLGGWSFVDMEAAGKLREDAGALLEAALTLLSDETKEGWERRVHRRGGGSGARRSTQGGGGGGGAHRGEPRLLAPQHRAAKLQSRRRASSSS